MVQIYAIEINKYHFPIMLSYLSILIMAVRNHNELGLIC